MRPLRIQAACLGTLVVLSSAPALADELTAFGAGARSVGMAGAGAALLDDSYAVHANPAGMAFGQPGVSVGFVGAVNRLKTRLSERPAGYDLPGYWRFTVTGTKGAVEAGANLGTVTLWPDAEGGPREIALLAPRTGGYLDDFLADIAGQPAPGGLDMARVFRSTRISLLAQRAATVGPIRLKIDA